MSCWLALHEWLPDVCPKLCEEFSNQETQTVGSQSAPQKGTTYLSYKLHPLASLSSIQSCQILGPFICLSIENIYNSIFYTTSQIDKLMFFLIVLCV